VTLLAIDTTLGRCSVLVWRAGAVVSAFSEPMARGHAERLAPMTQEAMLGAGLAFNALDRIVVTTGPGSFTGVRVGLSFARALALSLARPCVGLSTLEALALSHGNRGRRAGLIAAPPDGLFVAVYVDGVAEIPPQRALAGAVADIVTGAQCFGPAAEAFGGVMLDAPNLVAIAARAQALDPSDAPPAPLYLRAPHLTPPA
jgi:tRNA threonylcarbamoyladenosine biosynthesis protein TsaB